MSAPPPEPEAALRPDFRHVDVWIFDLDNTLYAADTDLFAQIDARMTEFIAGKFAVDHAEARAIQKTYYREHGTTLNGLMALHGTDPEAFLAFVHDIDLAPLAPAPRLAAAIAALPGRRFIFTNGCRNHAARVLGRLQLDRLFDDVWDIRTVGFKPKPDPDGYRTVLAQAAASGQRAAMFEDAARNLVPAHDLGMTTVWLKNDSQWSAQGPLHPLPQPGHIHYETTDLADFLHTIRI